MSIDRREQVLARLAEIIASPTLGFLSTFRNRGLIENDKHPSCVLLDGTESRKSATRPGRLGMSASIVTMRPQIFILLKNQKPKNSETIGQQLNDFRGKLLRAIAADAQLIALIGPNGDLNYDELDTDLKNGASLAGEAQITLSISVPFNPNA